MGALPSKTDQKAVVVPAEVRERVQKKTCF